MTQLLDTFHQLINGNYPDWDSLEFRNTQDAISKQHFHKFFKMRGLVDGLSHLTLGAQILKETKLPDRYEYKVTFKDELGSLELSSPIYSDEREIHEQLVAAYNSESVVELMIFVTPFPELDAKGKIHNHDTRVVTYWPVQARVLDKFEEEAAFIWTGNGWEITFRKHTQSYPDDNGFYYIHELLKKPDEEAESVDLTVGRHGVVIQNIEIDKFKDVMFNAHAKETEINTYLRKVKPDVRAKLRPLNREIIKHMKEINSLDPDIDKTRLEECQAILLQLKEEFFETLDMRDENNDTANSITQHTANYVSKAIRRALTKIKKDQPLLHAIIENRFITGKECKYLNRVDHPILWLT
jgi:hypothetical protein